MATAASNMFSYDSIQIPVVPHKAVAEVSESEPYRRGWWL